MQDKINIQDESGDHKYFTIIPNYILNHSTMWDREVYIQMKRITGEEGTCWTSKNTLSKQCGMSKRRLDKSIKYLLEHQWIKKVGSRKVETKGGIQEVLEYKIVDLWNLNNSFYQEKYKKGGAPETPPITKGGARKTQRGCTDEAKGGAQNDYKEEPYINKNHVNKIATQSVAGIDINSFIKLFEDVNPSYEQLYKNKTQRSAMERLIKKWGEEKMTNTIKALKDIVIKPYAPKITTPLELERDLGKLIAFYGQESQRIKKGGVFEA
mgnify:CR=1 FL=1